MLIQFFQERTKPRGRTFVHSYGLLLFQDFTKNVGKILSFSTTSHTE